MRKRLPARSCACQNAVMCVYSLKGFQLLLLSCEYTDYSSGGRGGEEGEEGEEGGKREKREKRGSSGGRGERRGEKRGKRGEKRGEKRGKRNILTVSFETTSYVPAVTPKLTSLFLGRVN